MNNVDKSYGIHYNFHVKDGVFMQIFNMNEYIDIKKTTSNIEKESANHYHPYYELVFIKQANFNYFIQNELFHISNWSIVLIDKNVFHKAIFKNTGKYIYYTIKFSESHIYEKFRDTCAKLFKKRHIQLNQNEYFLTDLLFSKIYHEFADKNKYWEELLNFQLNELIVLLSRINADKKTQSKNIFEPEIKSIIEYINENINAPITELSLAKTAEKYSMSISKLSRLFKTQIGIGYKEYIISNKLLNAKQIIASKKVPITEIAYRCGFNDSNYFATVFKQYEGISPSEYAKILKQNRP